MLAPVALISALFVGSFGSGNSSPASSDSGSQSPKKKKNNNNNNNKKFSSTKNSSESKKRRQSTTTNNNNNNSESESLSQSTNPILSSAIPLAATTLFAFVNRRKFSSVLSGGARSSSARFVKQTNAKSYYSNKSQQTTTTQNTTTQQSIQSSELSIQQSRSYSTIFKPRVGSVRMNSSQATATQMRPRPNPLPVFAVPPGAAAKSVVETFAQQQQAAPQQPQAIPTAASHAAAPASSTTPEKALLDSLEDKQLLDMLRSGQLQEHKLETSLTNLERAVSLRRMALLEKLGTEREHAIKDLPFQNYQYDKVVGQCCENVIGFVPIPVGIVGPLKLNGKNVYVPMATTEGCLVASAQRGAKAITESGGADASVINDGMTRAPVVQLPSAKMASQVKAWIEHPDNFAMLEASFNSTSRFARLKDLTVTQASRNLYLRFKSETGDAMGMNMLSKGTDYCLSVLQNNFPEMRIQAVSGNMCTDKKPSAINWIQGRGKSVVCEATIKADIVKNVLKTTVDGMVSLNISKNLVGSIMAGSIGGFNAHASNLVTAVYLATGQDPAQNVESSNCLTFMEKTEDGDLYISVTMPSIEVGTVGGGTGLPAQSAALDLMGLKGMSNVPGEKPRLLAQHIAATVLAGELNLMAALSAGHLVQSHLRLNRKKH